MTMAKPDKLMQKWVAGLPQHNANKATKIKDFKTLFVEQARVAGWKAMICEYEGAFQLSTQLTCSHGMGCTEFISGQLVLFAQQPSVIADLIISHARQACQEAHEPAPVIDYAENAWKYAYLTVPSTFYGWNSYGGNPVVDGLSKLVPSIATELVACPACIGVEAPIATVIPHINDTHRWTREQIADWLETLNIDLTIRPQDKTEEIPDAPDNPPGQGSVAISGATYSFVIYDDIISSNQLTGVA